MSHRQGGWWAWLAIGWLLLILAPGGWAEDDVQSWSTLEVTKRLGSSWEVCFRPEIRLRDDASELFYHEYRQGVRWNPSTSLQVGMNYLFVRNESSGKPREEHTGELDVTPKTTVGPWQLSVRGRIALKTIQRSAGEQEWQVRLMPKAAYPMQIGGRTITPYVADDVFYEYTRDAWNQNRLFLGVIVPLGKSRGIEVSADGYYMLQHQLGARRDWSSNHILGTKLNVRL